LGLIADIFCTIFGVTNNVKVEEEKSAVSELSIHERLARYDASFNSFEEHDELPFELSDNYDDVGYYSDVDSEEYDEFIFEVDDYKPFCHDFNIDGTAMISCDFDANGNSFGITNDDDY